MRRAILLLLAWLWPAVGHAATPLDLTYEGRLAGLTVIRVALRYSDDDTGYAFRAAIRSVGALAALVRGWSDVISQGVWNGAGAAPRHIDSEGYWNGRQRRLIVDYEAGVPDVKLRVPAATGQLPQDPQASVGSADALGLIAGVLHAVALTGRCDYHQRLFDGRSVTEVILNSAAAVPGDAGPRCAISTRKVARPGATGDVSRVGHGYAVFASPAPGLPAVPIRIAFGHYLSGEAVLVLTGATAATSPR